MTDREWRFPDFAPGVHGGTTDPSGRRWEHVPHEGWRVMRPNPYLATKGTLRPWWRWFR